MIVTWGGAAGFAAVFAAFLAVVGWFSSRKLLYGRFKSSPYSAVRSGWRSAIRLVRASPYVALGLFGAKLFQSLGKDLQNIYLWRHPEVWSTTGLGIDLIFVAIWAAVALRLDFFILVPEIEKADRRQRTRRAVLYALALWLLVLAIDFAGIHLVIWRRGADHGFVVRSLTYVFYAVATVAALVRPAIAVGLPRPLRECRRIFRENWLGAAVTLILAVLPFWMVFRVVDILPHLVRMKLWVALVLEAPIAAVSALCYLAFEGVVAAMYKRIM